MTTAQRILVAYGTLSLLVGFALGMPLSASRMRSPVAPRHLVTAHLSAIIQGATHLSLVIAVGFSTLAPWAETAAASSLAAGSALFVGGTVANWRQQVEDHFATRSLGWKLLSASSVGHLGGLAVIGVGVAAALAG